jgi:hypothetical protein
MADPGRIIVTGTATVEDKKEKETNGDPTKRRMS